MSGQRHWAEHAPDVTEDMLDRAFKAAQLPATERAVVVTRDTIRAAIVGALSEEWTVTCGSFNGVGVYARRDKDSVWIEVRTQDAPATMTPRVARELANALYTASRQAQQWR